MLIQIEREAEWGEIGSWPGDPQDFLTRGILQKAYYEKGHKESTLSEGLSPINYPR